MKGYINGRFKNYIIYVAASSSILFGSFFSNSTMYLSLSSHTPVVHDLDVDDDYKYSFGLRKIALFDYQNRKMFYTGNESQLSDKATIGAVDGWEYLFNIDAVRNRGIEFIDQKYWLKWSGDKFVTKINYTNKESRDLEFAEVDFRWRKQFLFLDFTSGYAIKGHPIYGHPAINDYNGVWWELAYDYGYSDYTYPIGDINGNDIIDSYWIWVETNPDTEEGYWEYWIEGIDYYWEDPQGNHVATSDDEFHVYHYPHVVDMYNEDNKSKSWEFELFAVIGLDLYLSGERFYTHIWVNSFPYSVGLTDKAYEGDEVQYDIGFLIGTNLSEHIGVFIEGNKQNLYMKEEYNVKLGMNYKF